MPKKMLIDATHPEETRVVVMHGNKLEDFDFESAARQQLIGNIYLAKVTRVEPSLQAAFVDYGGNRHGFLAFSEIHPDYYQIPIADRQALLDADAAEEQRAENADEDVTFETTGSEADDHHDEVVELAGEAVGALSDDSEDSGDSGAIEAADASEPQSGEAAPDADDDPPQSSNPMLMVAAEGDSISSEPLEEPGAADEEGKVHTADGADPSIEVSTGQSAEASAKAEALAEEEAPATAEAEIQATEDAPEQPRRRREGKRRDSAGRGRHDGGENRDNADWQNSRRIESVGGEDALDEVSRPRSRGRHYKIQEVIKKRQILLVQVLKDERGLKGAALTTYLSIPGRYCVLMPNTARGGGISRKIANAPDRKRLKAVAAELEVPEGMGLIIRTAGANRTKAEIKRDFEYLLRQWETIRELTLASSAPCLINQEGSIIKRAVRDLYDKDIESILVEGEAGYREAKDFMRMLMPSHAKKVQPYREPTPLFQRYQIEPQLDSMFDPTVRLKSGGYIVLNPTEALVSIDVNSGKSTREANIEATALRTNLEAAEEVARQLRLRDLAGLVVIDFIDMENSRNDRAVERKLKDCLATDRARIQVGRISPFGLLEMSRQRLRQGVVETTTRPCPHCAGTGLVRSVDSLALHVLRGIELEALRAQHRAFDAVAPTDVAVYILNQKRDWLAQIESRYGISVFVTADRDMLAPNFEIKPSDREVAPSQPSAPLVILPELEDDLEIEDNLETAADEMPAGETAPSHEPRQHQRNRSRERGETDVTPAQPSAQPAGEGEAANAPKRRRRRRRGGRDRNERSPGTIPLPQTSGSATGATGAVEPAAIAITPGSEPQPWIAHNDIAVSRSPQIAEASPVQPSTPTEPPKPDEPKRASWWQRRFGGGE